MSAIIDTFIVYRIVTTLTKDWDEQEAYKLGIIDKKGKVLKKSKELKTSEEKKNYTILTRFIFNLKRLIEKIPGGKSKIGSYAAAAYVFLKEESEFNQELKQLLGEQNEKKD